MRRSSTLVCGVSLALRAGDGLAQACVVRADASSLVVDVPVAAGPPHRVWLTDVPVTLRPGIGRVDVAGEAPVVFSGSAPSARLASARPLSLLGGMVRVAGNQPFTAYRAAEGALRVDLEAAEVTLAGLRVACGDVALHDPTRPAVPLVGDVSEGAPWTARGGALVLRGAPGVGLAVRVRGGPWRRLETAGRWWRVTAGSDALRVVGWALREQLRPWDGSLRSIGSSGAGGGGTTVRFEPGPGDFCGLATIAADTPLAGPVGAAPWGRASGAVLAEVSHRHDDPWVRVWRVCRDAGQCTSGRHAGLWVDSRVPRAAVTFRRAGPMGGCTSGSSWR